MHETNRNARIAIAEKFGFARLGNGASTVDFWQKNVRVFKNHNLKTDASRWCVNFNGRTVSFGTMHAAFERAALVVALGSN